MISVGKLGERCMGTTFAASCESKISQNKKGFGFFLKEYSEIRDSFSYQVDE